MLSIWNQGLPIVGEGLEYVSVVKTKKSVSLKQYGSDVDDLIHSKRTAFAPDDIFYLEKGKKIPSIDFLAKLYQLANIKDVPTEIKQMLNDARKQKLGKRF